MQSFQADAVMDSEYGFFLFQKIGEVVNIPRDVIHVGLLSNRFHGVIKAGQESTARKPGNVNPGSNIRRKTPANVFKKPLDAVHIRHRIAMIVSDVHCRLFELFWCASGVFQTK